VGHITEGRTCSGLRCVTTPDVRPPANGSATESAVDAFPRWGNLMDRFDRTLRGGEQFRDSRLAMASAAKRRVCSLDEVPWSRAPLFVEESFVPAEASDAGRSVLLRGSVRTREATRHRPTLWYVLAAASVFTSANRRELAGSDLLNPYLGHETHSLCLGHVAGERHHDDRRTTSPTSRD